MHAAKSSNEQLPRNKSAKPMQNSVPAKSSTNKKFFIGVSNLSASKRNFKKASDSSSKTIGLPSETVVGEIGTSEIGIQVDDIITIGNEYEQIAEEVGDGLVFRMPSANVVREIEEMRAIKKTEELKVRLKETRKFEAYAAKEEVHLNNLKEFLETSAITQKRFEESRTEVSDKTRYALEALDRIKLKGENRETT